MKRAFLYLILLSIVAAVGCRGPQAIPREDDYPASHYMTVRGMGDDRASAIDNARVELSRQISVRVRENFTTLERSLNAEGGASEHIRAVTRQAVFVSENDLPATDVAGTWRDFDLDVDCALVVLDRQAAGGRLLSEAQAAGGQGSEMFVRSIEALGAGRTAVGLANATEALHHTQEAMRLQLAGMVVDPGRTAQFRGVVDPELIVQIKNSLRSQLADIHVIAESGDHQQVYPGSEPRQALVVSVRSAGGDSVASLPILFKMDGSDAVHAAITGNDGRAQWQPGAVENGDGTAARTVSAVVDLARLAGSAPAAALLEDFNPPSTVFTIHMPTKDNIVFAVCLDGPAAAVQGALRAVADNDLTAVEQGAVAMVAREHELAPSAKARDLLKVLTREALDLPAGTFLFIVAGSVEPGEAKVQVVPVSEYVPAGRMLLVESTCKLQLIDSASGEVVATVSTSATEADLNDESAAKDRSVEAAANEGCSALIAGLLGKLKLAKE